MSITIHLSSLGDGICTVEDDGTPGNGFSVIRDPFASLVTDSLAFLSRSGQSLNVNLTDSLTTADFSIGSLTSTAVNPDSIGLAAILTSGTVTLAAAGTITEWGMDGATDIIAGVLLLDAGSGIGSGNAIETQVSLIEAESVIGGISISNIGNLQIGGSTAELRGLFTAVSGDIVVTNQGSIALADETGIESVHSAGNLTLNALGAAANLSSIVDQDALFAAGNIVLTAGQDISFGTIGTNFDNDVRAGGSITIVAGRDFNIDGFADMAADDQFQGSGGGLSITAGRKINIEDNNGTDASVGVSGPGGGSAVLTTGFGGTLSIAAASTAAVFSGSEGVVLNADRLLIEGDSGVTANAGGAVNISTASAGRAINLGSVVDGITALEISDAELDRVFTGNLIVGGAATGEVAVLSALTINAANFEIRSGSNIVVQADIAAAASVTLRADGDIAQLAGSTITTGTFNGFVDQDGAADPAGGTASLSGVVSTVSNLTGNVNADTLDGNDGVNTLTGAGGNDTLRGFGGADTLDGGTGNDNMAGGQGDDIYILDTAGDVVTENAGEGMDTVLSHVSWTLGAEIERLELLGSSTSGTGNALNNTLIGNSLDNVLNGAAGADDMNGGIGNDIYIVAAAGDLTTENGGEGTDTVRSYIDWMLADNVERLELAASVLTPINGTGNALANTLVGNSAANNLNGGEGNDYIVGGAGTTR